MVKQESNAEKYKSLLIKSIEAEIETMKEANEVFKKEKDTVYSNEERINDLEQELAELQKQDAETLFNEEIKALEESYAEHKKLMLERGQELPKYLQFLDMTREEKENDVIEDAQSSFYDNVAKLRTFSLAKALKIQKEQDYYETVGKYSVEELGKISDEELNEVVEVLKKDKNVKKIIGARKLDTSAIITGLATMAGFIGAIILDCTVISGELQGALSALTGTAWISSSPIMLKISEKLKKVEMTDINEVFRKAGINTEQENVL